MRRSSTDLTVRQKLTLIDDPLGCYIVCHTVNTISSARRMTSVVLDRGNRRYRRIIRTENKPLWNQLRSLLV